MLEIFQECTIHRREYFARLTAEKPSDFLPVELEGRRRHRRDRKGGDGNGGPLEQCSGREDDSDDSDFSDDSDKVGEKVLKGRWNGDGKCGRTCRRVGGTVTASAEEPAEGPVER